MPRSCDVRALVAVAILAACGCAPDQRTTKSFAVEPSQEAISIDFREHRAQFIQLLKLLEDDPRVDQVTRSGDVRLGVGSGSPSLAGDRAVAIKKCMARVGVIYLLRSSGNSVKFTTWQDPGAFREAATMGLLYTRRIPKPVVSNIDPGAQRATPRFVLYSSLSRDWFAFFDSGA